jgi:transposase
VFAERVMTVAHTARKQGTNVLAFLTASCKAQLESSAAPSLFAAAPAV